MDYAEPLLHTTSSSTNAYIGCRFHSSRLTQLIVIPFPANCIPNRSSDSSETVSSQSSFKPLYGTTDFEALFPTVWFAVQVVMIALNDLKIVNLFNKRISACVAAITHFIVFRVDKLGLLPHFTYRDHVRFYVISSLKTTAAGLHL